MWFISYNFLDLRQDIKKKKKEKRKKKLFI